MKSVTYLLDEYNCLTRNHGPVIIIPPGKVRDLPLWLAGFTYVRASY